MGRMPDSAPLSKGEAAINAAVAAIFAGVRQLVKAELHAAKGDGDPWVSQEDSPLGRREHCKLARSGALPGRKVGKRWLVRRSELDAYIEAHGATPKPAEAEPAGDQDEPTADDVLHELGLERVRGRR
ncbi:helix-turn-helix domain-containing protein [Sorangium sp. So ce315]|uniref:helix-turn-helix domain-containing protein n=1 Tax=Sorangium sp. So ce315 TaxID=3133299 RepID=UPI003F614295